jgi:hypothetical protein
MIWTILKEWLALIESPKSRELIKTIMAARNKLKNAMVNRFVGSLALKLAQLVQRAGERRNRWLG